jgi:hypothetical protein
MTKQTDFTEDEWAIIQKTLHEPGAAIMLAAPGGQLTEFFAIARAMIDAPAMFKDSELVHSLLAGMGQGIEPSKVETGTFMDQMIHHLRQAVKSIEAKATPEETESYRQLVTYIAEKIANAAKEGDKPVTDEEQRVLDEIRIALHRKA